MAELADVLVRIVAQRRQRIGAPTSSEKRGLGAVGTVQPPCNSQQDHPLLTALSPASTPKIIAEVKMGSPRLGSLEGRVDPERQAEAYARGGASALSVVVEPDFFGGSYELLERCRCASGLPSLAKDFVVDELQLHWAHEAGASAVLLIAALYDAEELAAYAGLARQLGLVPLVETHSADDVEKLAGAEWELIGVNNRDLRTFEVDLQHSMDLVASLPPAIKVAESGLESAVDIRALHRAGFDAFLIGESLLLAEDPAAKLAELLES